MSKAKKDEQFFFNGRDTARICGISENSFYRWDLEPTLIDGKKYFDIREAVKKRIENVSGESATKTVSSEKAKLLKVQTEEAELRLQERRSEVIPASTVESVWSEMISSLKAKLLSAPRKFAMRFPEKSSPQEREILLRQLVNEALAELREYDHEDYSRKEVKKKTG